MAMKETTGRDADTRVCGSDHTPVVSILKPKTQLPPDERPIPKWIAHHPHYPKVLASLLEDVDRDRLELHIVVKDSLAANAVCASLDRSEADVPTIPVLRYQLQRKIPLASVIVFPPIRLDSWDGRSESEAQTDARSDL